MQYTTIDSPCGPLIAVSDGEALIQLTFGAFPDTSARPPEDAAPGRDNILDALEIQLGEYFSKTRKAFDLPVKLYGSPFERSVWVALTAISYGKTITYAELAAAIGKPSAFRAAGSACGRNPVSIVVPCHRVVGSGGGPWRKRLTGFGGGLDNKKLLLELEGGL